MTRSGPASVHLPSVVFSWCACSRYWRRHRGRPDTTPIKGVEFVKLSELPVLGFSERFTELAIAGFPGAGSYLGSKSAIGL